jgi:hypothetical protein
VSHPIKKSNRPMIRAGVPKKTINAALSAGAALLAFRTTRMIRAAIVNQLAAVPAIPKTYSTGYKTNREMINVAVPMINAAVPKKTPLVFQAGV